MPDANHTQLMAEIARQYADMILMDIAPHDTDVMMSHAGPLVMLPVRQDQAPYAPRGNA